MILVDTSVWIEHLRARNEVLEDLLNDNQVLIHPFIIGEIACGNLAKRNEILSQLDDLRALPTATESEVLHFIEQRKLMGRGIGYIDAHLLVATALASSAQLWTRDKRLKRVVETMRLAYQPKE